MLSKLINYLINFKKNKKMIKEENNRINKQNSLVLNLLQNKDYYMLTQIIKEGVKINAYNQYMIRTVVREADCKKEFNYDFNDSYADFFDFIIDNNEAIHIETIVISIFAVIQKFDFYSIHFRDTNQWNSNNYFNPKLYEKYIDDFNLKNDDGENLYKRSMMGKLSYLNKKKILKNKKQLLFINKIINENLECFICFILRESFFYRNLVTKSNVNDLIILIDKSFHLLSEDGKRNVITLLFDFYQENRDEYQTNNIKNFIKKHQHYRMNIDIKDIVFNNERKISKENSEEIEVESTNKLLVKNVFPNQIKVLCDDIVKQYNQIKSNKEDVDTEVFLLIEKLVEEKMAISLKNLLSVSELNNLLDPSDKLINENSEEYFLCLKALNGIKNILIKEISLLKNKEKDKMLVLNNYIYAER